MALEDKLVGVSARDQESADYNDPLYEVLFRNTRKSTQVMVPESMVVAS